MTDSISFRKLTPPSRVPARRGVAGSLTVTPSSTPTTTGPSRSSPLWLHTEGTVNGVRYHWVEAGQRQDPLVLFLHGFGEFWFAWHHQLAEMAQRGYRVVAPDLRGYNLSDKPPTGYQLPAVADEILQLTTILTDRPVTIVGHDWGGLIAWVMAALFQSTGRIRNVCICAAPHPAMIDTRGWWIYSLPLECLYGWNRASWLVQRLQLGQSSSSRSSSHKLLTLEATTELYREAASQPGAIRGMLSYFRQNRKLPQLASSFDTIMIPVLLLWGERDSVWPPAKIEDYRDHYVRGPIEIAYVDSDHWVHRERPDQVMEYLMRFLERHQSFEPYSPTMTNTMASFV